MDGFRSAQLKLERARRICEVVLAAARDWSQTQSPKLVASTEPSDDGAGYDVVVRLYGVTAPDSLVLDIDDLLHHARSALDHVIWQFAIDAGLALKNQAFPVFEAPPDVRQWDRYVGGLPDPILDLVTAVQPFNRPATDRSLLWILHRLDIHAKHRSIVPTAAAVERVGFSTPKDISPTHFSLQYVTGMGAVDGAPILRATGVPEDYLPPEAAAWVDPFQVELWIPPTENTVAFSLAEGLPMVLAHASEIVSTLERIRSEPGQGTVWFHHSLPSNAMNVVARDADGHALDALGNRVPENDTFTFATR